MAYPDALRLVVENFPIEHSEVLRIITRSIERSQKSLYEIMKDHLIKNRYFNTKNQDTLFIRPYLISDIGRNLLYRCRKELNLTDKEFELQSRGISITKYDYPGPSESKDGKKRYGYRETWHLLEYGPKNRREELVDWWVDEHYDCTHSAFCDWYQWKKGILMKYWNDDYVWNPIDLIDAKKSFLMVKVMEF